MSKKKTWADVDKGDELDIDGRTWRVAKIKAKGKRTKVTLERNRHSFDEVVPTSDRVKIIRKLDPNLRSFIENVEKRTAERSKLHDDTGAQTRWATEREAEKAGVGLKPGNAEQTSPPAPATGDVWDRPSDRVEKMLDKLLGAHLVGEATDEESGYYVPPVDITTIAAHLVAFHGVSPRDYRDEDDMLAWHEAQHAAALKGDAILSPQHWHSEKRPS